MIVSFFIGGVFMKKKWLPLGIILSSVFLLAACQPKEEPKELALIAFDNVTKADGFNFSSEGEFKTDLSSLVGREYSDEYSDNVYKNFKGLNYKFSGGVDLNNKKFEEDFSLTVPFDKHKFKLDFAIQLDEKNKKVTIDNVKILNTIDSIWSFVKKEDIATLLSESTSGNAAVYEEVINDIDNIIAYFKKELKGSYTVYEDEYLAGFFADENYKEAVKIIRDELDKVPAEYFEYAKDKKGQYGNIIVNLSDKQAKEVYKTIIEDSYKPEKDATQEEIEIAEERKADALKEFEEGAKYVSVDELSFSLLVDDNKYPVSLDTTIKLTLTNPDNVKEVVTFEFNTSNGFDNFNKPTFKIPGKDSKVFTIEEIALMLEGKFAELEEKYAELEGSPAIF